MVEVSNTKNVQFCDFLFLLPCFLVRQLAASSALARPDALAILLQACLIFSVEILSRKLQCRNLANWHQLIEPSRF